MCITLAVVTLRSNQYVDTCRYTETTHLFQGFRRKEFRGKLAIAITVNFINRHSEAESHVEEISGVAFIFNQKFFNDLNEAKGISLENIVYYKVQFMSAVRPA